MRISRIRLSDETSRPSHTAHRAATHNPRCCAITGNTAQSSGAASTTSSRSMPPSLSRVTPSISRRTFAELIACAISCPCSLPALVSNQGPFPPPALPGFTSTTDLSATPQRPACPSRASGWSSLTTPWGFPCCVRFPCVHAVTTTPAQRLGSLLLYLPAVSAFPEMAIGSACATSFSRLAQCSLTLRPAHSRCHHIRGTLHRRLQPLCYLHSCSGCFRLEQIAGWDSHPLGKRRLNTAHARSGRLQ
jgi:hypothetical protein